MASRIRPPAASICGRRGGRAGHVPSGRHRRMPTEAARGSTLGTQRRAARTAPAHLVGHQGAVVLEELGLQAGLPRRPRRPPAPRRRPLEAQQPIHRHPAQRRGQLHHVPQREPAQQQHLLRPADRGEPGATRGRCCCRRLLTGRRRQHAAPSWAGGARVSRRAGRQLHNGARCCRCCCRRQRRLEHVSRCAARPGTRLPLLVLRRHPGWLASGLQHFKCLCRQPQFWDGMPLQCRQQLQQALHVPPSTLGRAAAGRRVGRLLVRCVA